jgi:hypothetical protein
VEQLVILDNHQQEEQEILRQLVHHKEILEEVQQEQLVNLRVVEVEELLQ